MKIRKLVQSLVICTAAWVLAACSLSYNLHDRYTFDLVDAGVDAASDGGATDGGDASATDAGPLPEVVRPIFPWNGYTTGSARVPRGAPIVDHPLRPKLMWRPVEGAERYEVQWEADCPIEGFRACTFPDPELEEVTSETTYRPTQFLEVSTVPPVGRRYVWRVRACNATGCGPYSEPRYLDVGRLKNDYNGDGYSDVVVGAPYLAEPETAEGGIFVYYGTSFGPSPEADQSMDNPDNESVGRFGYSIRDAGDVNADGFSDLIVGAPDNDAISPGGAAFLFFGAAGGISEMSMARLPNPTGLRYHFARSICGAGDVDGDGYSDLAISAIQQPSVMVSEGAVYIYYGPFLTDSVMPSLILENSYHTEQGGFGYEISGSGDLGGDGYVDLIISAPGSGTGFAVRSTVFVFMGGPMGLVEVPSVRIQNFDSRDGDYFGGSMASAGDADADGYADLIVAAPSANVDGMAEGEVFVFSGSDRGEIGRLQSEISNPLMQPNTFFGQPSSFVGDVNGDGLDDMVIGSPWIDYPEMDEGAIFFFYGMPPGYSSVPSFTVDNPEDAMAGFFGRSAAGVGDINGDGFFDLAVGAYRQNGAAVQDGAVFLFYGGISGLAESPSAVIRGPTGARSNFGFSLAQ